MDKCRAHTARKPKECETDTKRRKKAVFEHAAKRESLDFSDEEIARIDNLRAAIISAQGERDFSKLFPIHQIICMCAVAAGFRYAYKIAKISGLACASINKASKALQEKGVLTITEGRTAEGRRKNGFELTDFGKEMMELLSRTAPVKLGIRWMELKLQEEFNEYVDNFAKGMGIPREDVLAIIRDKLSKQPKSAE